MSGDRHRPGEAWAGGDGRTARRYHEVTSHWPRPRRRAAELRPFAAMDPSNMPAPFKRYPDAALRALPTDVLAGEPPVPRVADIRQVARLLFLSGGVTRLARRGRGRTYFRAAASAGNLHPLDTYLVTGDLDALDAGVYHFAPDVFALELLRPGDFRPALARGAALPEVAVGPALVISGVPWRTAWKYGERGWRHIYWDAGTMLANLLAVADADGLQVRVLLGFEDAAVRGLLGLDGGDEFPVVIASFPAGAAGEGAERPGGPAGHGLGSTPMSREPIEFPLITSAQQAGELHSPEEVTAWRESSGAAAPAGWGAAGLPGTPVEAVIRRRGSTRAMQPAPVPAAVLSRGMGYAARVAPLDALPAGGTLLRHYLSVHSVDGYEPGLYEWTDGGVVPVRPMSAVQARATARHLCLDQPLGGDSAYTLFACADLTACLDSLGDRGYRVAQAEAGIVAGRLQLAAFGLGHGATGLTFYDDEVAAAFDTDAACMLVCAVGVPAYRSTPGGTPGHPRELSAP